MELLNKVKKIVQEVLTQLTLSDSDVKVELKAGDNDKNYIKIELTGDNLRELIGYHGKNIDALQQLLSLLLRKELQQESLGLILDINKYKEKRTEYIKDLAKKAALEVMQTKQSVELVPMKPFERRIIHLTIKDEEGLESESIGEDDQRRVVIKPLK